MTPPPRPPAVLRIHASVCFCFVSLFILFSGFHTTEVPPSLNDVTSVYSTKRRLHVKTRLPAGATLSSLQGRRNWGASLTQHGTGGRGVVFRLTLGGTDNDACPLTVSSGGTQAGSLTDWMLLRNWNKEREGLALTLAEPASASESHEPRATQMPPGSLPPRPRAKHTNLKPS